MTEKKDLNPPYTKVETDALIKQGSLSVETGPDGKNRFAWMVRAGFSPVLGPRFRKVYYQLATRTNSLVPESDNSMDQPLKFSDNAFNALEALLKKTASPSPSVQANKESAQGRQPGQNRGPAILPGTFTAVNQ